jgi:hypothetical protein
MTAEKSLVPTGISHEIDLSKMNYNDRMKHHTRQLNTIARYDGLNGVQAYQARYPETASLRMEGRHIIYAPKPSGYMAAITGMVGLWFDSAIALAATNRADVERLNSKLGTAYDPDRFFSRKLTPSIRKRLEEIFDKRGAVLPEGAASITAVRQAVKAYRAGTGSNVKPFGKVATRTPRTLTIGTRAFAIETHNGREGIRLTVDSKRERVSLTAIKELLSGLETEGNRNEPRPSMYIHTRELAPNPETGQETGLCDTPGASSHQHSHISDGPADAPAPSQSDRIKKLRAAWQHDLSAWDGNGPDPLEL